MSDTLLITGCGLGATHYTARLLQACGLDIGHECVREDGAVSWKHATEADQFDVVLRQIRNPRKVATSMGKTANKNSWSYAQSALETTLDVPLDWPPGDTEDEQMRAGVAYTYWWYIHAGLRSRWTYRVEYMDYVLPCILDAAGYDVHINWQKRALEDVSTEASSRQNDRDYEYWTWEQIERVPWGQDLHAMSRAYGYYLGAGI